MLAPKPFKLLLVTDVWKPYVSGLVRTFVTTVEHLERRGVDLELFRPRPRDFLTDPRPICLYVGRVSKEKNLPAFLNLRLPGTKYVLGDGPLLKPLREKYPEVRFLGVQQGEQLARYYAAADVLVFPSLTDTFGLVLLEALACGTPVAAYPVTGPIDVVGNAPVGALDEDLERAVQRALAIPRDNCREFAERFSWDVSARQFLRNLHPIHRPQLAWPAPSDVAALGPTLRETEDPLTPASPARGRIPPRAA